MHLFDYQNIIFSLLLCYFAFINSLHLCEEVIIDLFDFHLELGNFFLQSQFVRLTQLNKRIVLLLYTIELFLKALNMQFHLLLTFYMRPALRLQLSQDLFVLAMGHGDRGIRAL